MYEGSRFDRCKWLGCDASCVDEIELCWYHFRLAGETYVEKRSPFGSAALAEARERREAEAAERAQLPTRDDWLLSRSVVYYIRIGDHVKIGFTAHLPSRVTSLRVERDAVLAVEPGAREQETVRHGQFVPERIGRREDFNPSRRLLAHIDVVRSKYGEPWAYAERRTSAAGPQPLAG